MSITIEVLVECDGLGRFGCVDYAGVSARTAGRARRELRERGWLVNQPGGKDYCPNHRHLARGGAR